jgi:hypothetical protein
MGEIRTAYRVFILEVLNYQGLLPEMKVSETDVSEEYIVISSRSKNKSKKPA